LIEYSINSVGRTPIPQRDLPTRCGGSIATIVRYTVQSLLKYYGTSAPRIASLAVAPQDLY
jgi:hypothetical protein